MTNIDTWIICVAGFTEHAGQSEGIEELQDEIRVGCAGKNTIVSLYEWKTRVDYIADVIQKRRRKGANPRIVLIGYSYGGSTAVHLAKVLKARGLEVEVLVLIDAVWRPYPHLPSALSLLPFWIIKVPDTVQNLYSWRQKESWLRGHRLRVSSNTNHRKKTLSCKHVFCDEQPEVREVILKVACPEQNSGDLIYVSNSTPTT